MVSLTFHQPMVELLGCFNNYIYQPTDILGWINQHPITTTTTTTFLNQQQQSIFNPITTTMYFLLTKFGYGLFSLLPTHGRVFGLLRALALDALP